MAIKVNRAVLARPWLTGISQHHLAALTEDLAHPWATAVEDHRHRTRGGLRKRAAGAGARDRLVFVDRLVVTLIHLRHDLPHAVLGLLFGVDRSTVTRAVGQIRALLASVDARSRTARGCACAPWRTCSPTPGPKGWN